jgi:hypothetical protein
MYTVIQTPPFMRSAPQFWSEEEIEEFIVFMAENSDAGDVIKGTKSLRKVRWAANGKGKSGGARVIYFTKNSEGQVILLVAYAKNVCDNLPTSFINQLKDKYGNI